MRVRISSRLLLGFVALATPITAASAQEEGEAKKKEQEKTRLRQPASEISQGDDDSAVNAGLPGTQSPGSEALTWESLTDKLFVSGERGIADPGKVEPEPRRSFHLGPVALLPKFDETIVYDDNVFLTENNEQDDVIFRTRMALIADWDIGATGHKLNGGFDMTRHWFSGGEARNFVETLGSVQLELNYQHLRISVGDRYEDRTDPILSVFTAKIERTINTVYGTGGWYEDAQYFEVKANNVTTDYDDDSFDAFDRSEALAQGEVGWLVEEDVWAFARLGLINRVFDNDGLNDMFGEVASVGLRLKRSPRFDGSIRIGVRAEQFDDDFPTDGDDSAINPEIEGRALWWPTRIDGLDVRYVHTTEFSPVSNYETLDRGEIGWTRVITPRVRGRAGFGIEFVNPSDVADEFVRYSIGAGLAWRALDYVDVTANWNVRIRNSDVAGGDYTGNQFSVGVAVRL